MKSNNCEINAGASTSQQSSAKKVLNPLHKKPSTSPDSGSNQRKNVVLNPFHKFGFTKEESEFLENDVSN